MRVRVVNRERLVAITLFVLFVLRRYRPSGEKQAARYRRADYRSCYQSSFSHESTPFVAYGSQMDTMDGAWQQNLIRLNRHDRTAGCPPQTGSRGRRAG